MCFDVSAAISKSDASRYIDNRFSARGYRRAYQCASDADSARKRHGYAYCGSNCTGRSGCYIQCFSNADCDSAKSCANAYCAANGCGNYCSHAHSDAETEANADAETEANADTKSYSHASASGHANNCAL
jgi:hypothetical protein